jgi:hypothetical protein
MSKKYAIGVCVFCRAYGSLFSDSSAEESSCRQWQRPEIMSAEALRFVWGEPYYSSGDARRSAHWYYLGSSLALAERGNQYYEFSNRVDVYLMDGRVVGWVDYVPSDVDSERRFHW